MMYLSSVVAVAVLAATASIRSISARRAAMTAASHCSSVKEAHCSSVKEFREGPAGAAFCSFCEVMDDCWGVMLLKLRSVGFIGMNAGAGAGF